jgi:hypothetical protein
MREILYNILVDFEVPMNPVRLITLSSHEIYSKIYIIKHLYDNCSIQNGFKTLRYLIATTFQLSFAICH